MVSVEFRASANVSNRESTYQRKLQRHFEIYFGARNFDLLVKHFGRRREMALLKFQLCERSNSGLALGIHDQGFTNGLLGGLSVRLPLEMARPLFTSRQDVDGWRSMAV